MASLRFEEIGKTSIEVKVYVDEQDEEESSYTYRLFCRLYDEPKTQMADYKKTTKSDFTHTISGLQKGTLYAFNLGVDRKDGRGNIWEYDDPPSARTEWLNTPSASVSSVDGSIVYIDVAAHDRDAESFAIYSTHVEIRGSISNNKYDVEVPFDKFNTRYYVSVYTYDEKGHQSPEYEMTVRTDPLSNWVWNSRERTAFRNKGLTSELKATRWQAFCKYLNELSRAAVNANLVSRHYPIPTEVFEDLESGDIMTVDSFYAVFELLEYLSSECDIEYDYPGESALQKGKIIYGHYFTDAKDVTDSIVDLINEG